MSFILKKSYIGLLLDKYTRKSWILLLRNKDEFFDIFKQWLFRAEFLSRKKLGCLWADNREEFISNALKFYCQKWRIKIGYIAPYMYKENKIAERFWKMLVIMKDVLLIDGDFTVNFWAETIDISNYLQNKYLTKYFKCKIILEKTWTRKRQDIQHHRIIGCKISTFIPTKKLLSPIFIKLGKRSLLTI